MTASDNRDPFPCPYCETVNAWSATHCRSCEKPISKETAEAEAKALRGEILAPGTANDAAAPATAEVSRKTAPDAGAPPRRWNLFWIMLGIAIHIAGVHLVVFGIFKLLVEPDTELRQKFEQTLAAAQSGDEDQASVFDNAPAPMKSKIAKIRTLLVLLLALVAVAIGMSVGFFAGTILDGAAAMGLSTVLILRGAAEYALVLGPVNAAIGALGAFIGVRLARRFRNPSVVPPPPE